MVTWSVVSDDSSSLLEQFFASGFSPDYDSANFAALCFVASLGATSGDALYYVTIGIDDSYAISALDACDFVLRTLQVLEAFWQLRDAGSVQ